MTTITFCEDGNLRRIKVEGHSGYAEKGKDIVCAGISALTQSYIFFTKDLQDRSLVSVRRMFIADGFVDVITERGTVESMIAYEITKQGLEAIECSYPDNVKIVFEKNID